jgi:hypothetical protein
MPYFIDFLKYAAGFAFILAAAFLAIHFFTDAGMK